MAHYIHTIFLDDIAAEVGMNRSAFCSYFKRCKGMTFSQYVTQYRLNTACELLKHSQKQVSEICFTVGFNDLPHFVRVFTNTLGMSPSKYRRQFQQSSLSPKTILYPNHLMPFLPFYSFIPEILGKFAHTLYKISYFFFIFVLISSNTRT